MTAHNLNLCANIRSSMKTFKLIRLSLLSLFLVIGMIACGAGDTGGGGNEFSVSLSSSNTNVTTASTLTLTATGTNGTLASVQFLKNGAAIATPITTAPFQVQVELSSADNGSISFTATATDTNGATATSSAVTVTVNIAADVTAPTISLASSSTSVTNVSSIELTATANDDVAVARVEFFKNGTKLINDFDAPFQLTANITQDDNGTATFTATAFDAAGNSTTSTPVAVTVNISVATLLRPSKSSAIALSGNDKYVIQVNPETDSVSVFKTIDDSKLSELPVGIEPSSVVVAPDDISAYVAVRGEAKVVKINDINIANPSITATVAVGSEPTGIALSPSGKLLVVAEFAESRVSLINTDSMTIVGSVDVRNPRAVAITNDGDGDDSDEKVIVTEFYGEVLANTIEGTDGTRKGVVRIFNLGATSLTLAQKVEFAPVATPDFAPTQQTSPNQLYSVAVTPDNSKFLVTATAASPNGITSSNQNIYQLLLVGDIATGQAIEAINISAGIKNLDTKGKDKFFMADIVDLALVGNNIIYLASRGADHFQRAVLAADGRSVTLGANQAAQVDLLGNGCQAPIGVVTPNDTNDNKTMYLNCWVSRSMSTVNLATQEALENIQASAPPVGEEEILTKGLRFYFTGRGRWSDQSWSSCGSCHPDGLSDNITWQFPAGPRQTTSMDGTFSKGPGDQKERILNWSGIFDELHDFERNTRGVSNGIGALVTDIALDPANRLSLNGFAPVGKPLKDLQNGLALDENGNGPSVIKDWDEIEEWVKTIRPPLGKQFSDPASVARGRALFTGAGNCASCHGGAGWTVSRRFYEPSVATNAALLTQPFSDALSPHTTQIGLEPDGGAGIAPPHVACVLREVGTFGVFNDPTATDLTEVKGLAGSPRAQGEFAGYNIPSLYGLQVGAPFLHHGQATSLEQLMSSLAYQEHLTAGNAIFTPSAAEQTDLINFLLSIDASTPEITPPAGSDKCPQ